ncbi:MAG: glycosyltransferase family 2 protein [Flavisolibacter sp.]|jgi:glycosyltransferase involved in cell wall biosynthesis|nr:glycosyltransferase family 2 protein [Flavisolibacter sp.]
MNEKAWVSFCISTYRRPDLLRQQIASLLKQTFTNFMIIISDNDPQASAQPIASEFADPRVKYYHNQDNLGMVKSFNLSISRAVSDYIVMVTDDDPVENKFLEIAHELWESDPNKTIYCGFLRNGKKEGEVENIGRENFASEILDTDRTKSILWSSSVMLKSAMEEVGLMPDYGSPHLADHALIAMVGSIGGGLVKNRMYSSLTSHNTNFSKAHIDVYYSGCKGFYDKMHQFQLEKTYVKGVMPVVKKHLGVWFIGSFFILKKYYTIQRPDPDVLKEIDAFALQILELPFMKSFALKFFAKRFIFMLKKNLRLLK